MQILWQLIGRAAQHLPLLCMLRQYPHFLLNESIQNITQNCSVRRVKLHCTSLPNGRLSWPCTEGVRTEEDIFVLPASHTMHNASLLERRSFKPITKLTDFLPLLMQISVRKCTLTQCTNGYFQTIFHKSHQRPICQNSQELLSATQNRTVLLEGPWQKPDPYTQPLPLICFSSYKGCLTNFILKPHFWYNCCHRKL